MADNISSSNMDCEGNIGWKEKLVLKQQFYCKFLGDRWEEYKKDDILFLQLKIGFLLYGSPEKVDDCNYWKMFYTKKEEKENIDNLTNLILRKCKSEDIHIGFLYILASLENGCIAEFPIIRILIGRDENGKDICNFVDLLQRVYSSWNDFLQKNNLPNCNYCYPKNGYYCLNSCGEVDLEFGVASSERTLQVFDKLSNVLQVGGIIVEGIAVMTPLAPVVLTTTAISLGASSLWGSFRSASSLIDRYKHEQSLSPLKIDSGLEWANLMGGLLGTTSLAATKYTQAIARDGKILSKSNAKLFNSIAACSVACNGLGILNQIQLLRKKEEITATDIMQVAISFLFFCHSAVSFKTVKEVMLEVQNDTISKIESSLTKNESKAFKKIARGIAVTEDEISRNALLIRSVKNISNEGHFFKKLRYFIKEANKTIRLIEGRISWNEKLETDLTFFNNLSNKSKKIILYLSKRFKKETGTTDKKETGTTDSGLKNDFTKKINILKKIAGHDYTSVLKILEDIISKDSLYNALDEFISMYQKPEDKELKEIWRLQCQRTVSSEPFSSWDYFNNSAQILLDTLIEPENAIVTDLVGLNGWEFLFKKPLRGIKVIYIICDCFDVKKENFEVIFYQDANEKVDWKLKEQSKKSKHTFFQPEKISSCAWEYFQLYAKDFFDPVKESDLITIDKDSGWYLVFSAVNRGVKYIIIDTFRYENGLEKIQVSYQTI